MFTWNATIVGPDDSPFEGEFEACAGVPARARPLSRNRLNVRRNLSATAGGIYQLRVQFPDSYPDKPPKVRFVSEMFHPNVSAQLLSDDVG